MLVPRLNFWQDRKLRRDNLGQKSNGFWSVLFYLYVLHNSFERLRELINFRQSFSLKQSFQIWDLVLMDYLLMDFV